MRRRHLKWVVGGGGDEEREGGREEWRSVCSPQVVLLCLRFVSLPSPSRNWHTPALLMYISRESYGFPGIGLLLSVSVQLVT